MYCNVLRQPPVHSAPLQVRGTVQRVQLDDQMALAAHPVVLSPAGLGHESVTLEAVNALLTTSDPGAAASAAAQRLQGGASSSGPQPLVRWTPCGRRSIRRRAGRRLFPHLRAFFPACA